MILDPNPQGSVGWIKARLGIPTASNLNKLITPARRQPSKQADTLLMVLLAEWLTGEPADTEAKSFWTERGSLVEPESAAAYEALTDAKCDEVGFAYLDDRLLFGASVDRLVGEEGQVEIKSPSAPVHLATLLFDAVPEDHTNQIQGGLWVTGRQWCDFVSYHPHMPPFVRRVERDEAIIPELKEHVEAFIVRMVEGRLRLLELGYEPRVASPAADEVGF